MSRPAPRQLGFVLEKMTAALAPASDLARVQAIWDDAVGREVAAAARPTAMRAGALTVTCEASVWAQELELMGPALLERLNALLAGTAVTELRCRTG
jgi:predicted nucleic acid-binding Zn ribbon protein